MINYFLIFYKPYPPLTGSLKRKLCGGKNENDKNIIIIIPIKNVKLKIDEVIY